MQKVKTHCNLMNESLPSSTYAIINQNLHHMRTLKIIDMSESHITLLES